jgi:hypothetical protein
VCGCYLDHHIVLEEYQFQFLFFSGPFVGALGEAKQSRKNPLLASPIHQKIKLNSLFSPINNKQTSQIAEAERREEKNLAYHCSPPPLSHQYNLEERDSFFGHFGLFSSFLVASRTN